MLIKYKHIKTRLDEYLNDTYIKRIFVLFNEIKLRKKRVKIAKDIIKLSEDLATFNNLSIKEATNSLKLALRGKLCK